MVQERVRVLCCCLVVLVVAGALSGCGGQDSSTGGAAGWIYQPTGGGQPIISASITPPEGYQPVSNVTVSIGGYPELTTATDSSGAYLITSIPTGTQPLVVTVSGHAPLSVNIPIIANHVTLGSGHEEGGGGLG